MRRCADARSRAAVILHGAALAIAGLTGSCSSPGSAAPSTAVVIGIQSEVLGGAVGALHVVTTINGAPSTDETLTFTNSGALPHEVTLLPPLTGVGAAIAVRVDGYQRTDWSTRSSDSSVLVRTAETHFVTGRRALLRVILQGQCLLMLPGGPPGGPACGAPQTCIAGVCRDDTVAPRDLEPYSPNWAGNAPDVCKPANAGTPVVQVGTGQSDYLPLSNGQSIQMEQGPQGGHHVWIAVRQENLKQSGSTTTITSVQPGTGLAGPRTSFAFTFDSDQGGFCKLAGMRYQLDIGGIDYHQFLGKALDVTVVVKDASGATGTGVAHVDIAPQILCASGIPGC